jgi:hypothetical protein
MVTEQIEVRHGDLTAHAARVEAIGAHVSAAARAAGAVRAGGEAYGRLCVLVPVAVNLLQDIVVGGITATAGSLHDTGARLRSTAQEYTAADQRRRRAFQR